MLSGLEPLKGLDAERLAPAAGQSLDELLPRIATALESFFGRALPIIEALQADPALRAEFAGRLAELDLGPHRGVRLVSEYLSQMAETGAVSPDVNTEATALPLVGPAPCAPGSVI